MHLRLCLLGLLLMVNTGCNSIQTTFLQQNECGQLVKNSQHARRGVPVMVKVPTHVEVKIIQTDIWRIDSQDKASKKLVHVPEATSRRAEIETVFTEQMFLINPKRPASGTGEFALGLSEDGKGILRSANYKAVDTTLKDSANLLTTAISTLGGVKTSIDRDSARIVSAERTVTYRRFPIDQNTESEIEQLLEQYINRCSTGDCILAPGYAPDTLTSTKE